MTMPAVEKPSALLTFLLPGLDGTGHLFDPFIKELSPRLSPRVIPYPHDTPLGYRELISHIAAELPGDRPLALIAESFSGPLALELVCDAGLSVVGVVLVATFVQSPIRWLPAQLARDAFFRIAPPRAALRHLLTGEDAPEGLLDELVAAIRGVRPEVVARRVREVLSVDARDALVRCPAPILYLAGSRDRLVAPKTGERLQRLRPLQCEMLDAPHLVLQRAPAAAAEAIERFLLAAAAEAA